MLRPYRSVYPTVHPSAFVDASAQVVAAGTLVLEGCVVPPGSVVMRLPGTVRRPLTPGEDASIKWDADNYVRHRLDFQTEHAPA